MAVPVSSLSMAGTGNPLPDAVEKDWAVYIYCGADNEYDVSAEFALEQCEKGMAAGIAEAAGEEDPITVHVVMYLDAKGAGNTVVYDLSSGEAVPVDMMDNGEYDSSNGATLTEFLTKAMDHYPSGNTMLIVKNGHAWCGVCPDDDATEEAYLMPVNELAEVLTACGCVDVLALDGDNMASIEVAYELRNSCSYLVASQQDVPLDGLPYCLFMEYLANNSEPAIPSQEDVAKTMVDKYVYYYNNTDGKKVLYDHLLSNSQMAVTASAFRMQDDMQGDETNNMEDIVTSFDACLDFMMNTKVAVEGMEDTYPWSSVYRNVIASARDTALIGKMGDQAGYEWLPDVYTWLDKIVEYYEIEETCDESILTALRTAVDIFKGEFNAAVVDMEQSQILNRSGNSFPHGLNIWFPPTWLQWDTFDYTRTRTYLYDGSNVPLPAEYYCVDCPLDYNEINLAFVKDTMWMDFLALHYDARWTVYGNSDAPKEKPSR